MSEMVVDTVLTGFKKLSSNVCNKFTILRNQQSESLQLPLRPQLEELFLNRTSNNHGEVYSDCEKLTSRNSFGV